MDNNTETVTSDAAIKIEVDNITQHAWMILPHLIKNNITDDDAVKRAFKLASKFHAYSDNLRSRVFATEKTESQN